MVITYLGMSLPMTVSSTITWLKNPSGNGNEVKIQKLKSKYIIDIVIIWRINYICVLFNIKKIKYS